ncbi:MAG: M48 family metallopeptidase, partial [Planctomycetota bacterium]
MVVAGLPLLLALAGVWAANRACTLHDKHPDAPHVAQQFHHRTVLFLRTALFVGFAAAVLLTRWPDWFDFGRITPALQIVGDLIVLSPFFVGTLVLWIAAYPVERALRLFGDPRSSGGAQAGGPGWRMGTYLDFHLRHQLLVVAAPMTLILFAANMTRGYDAQLRRWTGWVWTPDVLLAVVAGCVFVVAPLLLCRIWRTAPLEAGPLRGRLEDICRRIGLRCRDILIWKSDGIMINAAVMGVFAPVRYVLLSDALLATMSTRQIEAVFGHEAGHVRHRHIQHFLVFALVGWLAVAGLMEGLARTSMGSKAWWGLSSITIQGLGLAATVLFWGLGFGWVSRRFERQADLFGARCVTPSDAECDRPCSVHLDARTSCTQDGRVCATAAAVFASALQRVALLNGIPSEERSWRHSSIGSRIRFLVSLAGDPARAMRFERLIRRIKTSLLAAAVLGGAFFIYYWTVVPQPTLMQLQAG